jgi:hypothetical protein
MFAFNAEYGVKIRNSYKPFFAENNTFHDNKRGDLVNLDTATLLVKPPVIWRLFQSSLTLFVPWPAIEPSATNITVELLGDGLLLCPHSSL